MKLLQVLSILLLFMVACKKADPVYPSGAERIIGEWRWLKGSGGFAGEQILPTHPEDRKLKFYQNGTYACLCDGLVTGNYGIGEPEWETFEHRIFFNEVPARHRMWSVQDVRFVSADTMVLADACYDCYAYTYVRY